MRNAVVASSALPVYGARRRTPATMPAPYGAPWTTAPRTASSARRMTMAPRNSAMEYTFTLKYQLTDDDRDSQTLVERLGEAGCDDALVGIGQPGRLALEDRKSTRLNSSHLVISYAVFCLKKKKK